MMVVDNKYTFGDIVFLKTDQEQSLRIITRILVDPAGIMYQLSCGIVFSDHYEFEITEEKNVSVL